MTETIRWERKGVQGVCEGGRGKWRKKVKGDTQVIGVCILCIFSNTCLMRISDTHSEISYPL